MTNGSGPDWAKVTTKARKFGIALLGFVFTAAAAGLLPEPYNTWVASLVPFATAIGVYAIPNAPQPPRR